MKKEMKKTFVLMLVTGLFMSIAGIASAVETEVSKITVSPSQPIQKTAVTFSVAITGDNIEEVYIEVEECTDPESANYFCHPVYNLSATETDGVWEVTKTLEYSDTAEGHCWPVVLDNGTWTSYKTDYSKWTNFTVLPPEEDGDGNGGDGGDDDTDDSPGFELIFIMISIIAIYFVYKRKRIR